VVLAIIVVVIVNGSFGSSSVDGIVSNIGHSIGW